MSISFSRPVTNSKISMSDTISFSSACISEISGHGSFLLAFAFFVHFYGFSFFFLFGFFHSSLSLSTRMLASNVVNEVFSVLLADRISSSAMNSMSLLFIKLSISSSLSLSILLNKA